MTLQILYTILWIKKLVHTNFFFSTFTYNYFKLNLIFLFNILFIK